MTPSSISRRSLLQAGGAAAALAGGARFNLLSAQQNEIVFGVVTQNTGTYAYAGELVTRGATLACEERNWSILGRKIKLIARDDEGRPAVGARRVAEAVSGENMKFFNGNYSSAVGLAEAEVAQREKVLQYAAGGSEDFTGARCSRYTFQWSASPYTALKTVFDHVAKALPNAKRFYAVTADYVFGHALLKYARVAAQKNGFEIVGNDMVPLGERQYTQYLTKALAARPDVLLLNNAGADAVTTVRQFANFGARGVSVVAPWAIEVDELKELTPQMRAGLLLGQNYYHEIDTPTNKAFVQRWIGKHNFPPGYAGAYGYDSFRTILLAMEKANSVEVPDVIKALEGLAYEGVLGPTTIDPNTHQTIRPYYVVRGKAQADMKSESDYAEIVAVGSEPQPKDLNECKGLGPI